MDITVTNQSEINLSQLTNDMSRILEERKKAEAEFRKLEVKEREIAERKGQLRFLITKLDEMMDDSERAEIGPKKPGDPTSLPVLIENILADHPEGLTMPEVLIEVEKTGFESKAKEPLASISTVLYRHRPARFERVRDGRWYLAKYPEPPARLRMAGT
jgi:hypothetical protein